METWYHYIPLDWLHWHAISTREREREWSTSKNNFSIILDTLVASVMPSISPVHSLSVEDEEERGDQIRKIVSARKSRSPGSTFSERLKAARKLIPSYPGRAKLVRSVSESSGLTLTTNDQRIHSKAETESCATIQDFGTFFREHAIIMELWVNQILARFLFKSFSLYYLN